jgi:hypothetical protein
MRKLFSQKSKQKTGSSTVMPLLPFNKDDEKQITKEKPSDAQTADNPVKQDDNIEKSKKLFVVVSGKYLKKISNE